MKVIQDDQTDELLPSVATIGCFDGVHRGHRYLLSQVREIARQEGLSSALITFPVHPRQVMQSDYQPQLLSCLRQKTVLLEALEGDYCIMMPFTPELSRLTARQFMQLLRDRFFIRALVIGHDHRFGHNRSEGFDDYCRYGQELGIKVVRARALVEDNVSVSSSLIRHSLQEGRIERANHYLGYAYYLDGTVVNGYQMGRKLGFPTANLQPSCPDKLIPAEGVYAVRVCVEGKSYAGMLNIGHRPTLDNGVDRSIEVHILDFSGDIYSRKMRIEFAHFIRKEEKFASLDALIARLHQDRAEVVRLLSPEPPRP